MNKIAFTFALVLRTVAVPGAVFAQAGKAFDSLQMKGVAVVKVPVDGAAAAQL